MSPGWGGAGAGPAPGAASRGPLRAVGRCPPPPFPARSPRPPPPAPRPPEKLVNTLIHSRRRGIMPQFPSRGRFCAATSGGVTWRVGSCAFPSPGELSERPHRRTSVPGPPWEDRTVSSSLRVGFPRKKTLSQERNTARPAPLYRGVPRMQPGRLRKRCPLPAAL